MQEPRRIYHIPRRFVTDEWGGSETFISEIAVRQKAAGLQPEILTTLALSTERAEEHRGVQVRRFPYFYPYLGLKPAQKAALDKKAGNLFSFSLMRALRKGPRPDLIHLHTGKRLGGIIRHYAVKRGIPYVISLHGGKLAVPQAEQETWTEPTKGAFEWGKLLGMLVGSRRVLEDAAAVICVGREEYEAVSRQFPDKEVIYLPNGVDVKRFSTGDGAAFRKKYGIPSDRFVCLTAARIDVQKNQTALIEALSGCAAELPKLHLLLLGAVTTPSYLEEVNRLIDSEGLADRVTIIPGIPYQSPDLIDAYHASDCFMLPSLHEPFGMVVLEAWAAGLPTAASARGGLTGIITHGENGLLFEPVPSDDGEHSADGKWFSSITESFCYLYGEREERMRLAEAGRRRAREVYSWDAVALHLLAIYRGVYARTLP